MVVEEEEEEGRFANVVEGRDVRVEGGGAVGLLGGAVGLLGGANVFLCLCTLILYRR